MKKTTFKKHYFLIGQKAIVANEEGDILLLRRSEKCLAAGRWDFVGGGLENKENPIDGIKREIKEESGLNVKKVIPIKITSHQENQDSVLLIFYQAIATSSKVKLSWEHDQFMWINKEKALKLKIPKTMKEMIKLLN